MKFSFNRRLLLITIIIVLLTSCKQAVLSESEILQDLNSTGIINVVIDNKQNSINVSDVAIEKRQTSDETDIVYAYVHQKNSSYDIESYLIITYNLFDEGWIISDYVVQEGPSIKTNLGIDKMIPDSYMREKYSSFDFISNKFEINSQQDIYTYSFSGESNTSKYSGKIDLIYNFDYKWELVDESEYELTTEYFPTGIWRLESVSDKYPNWEINITDIDNQNKNITYNYRKLNLNIHNGNYETVYESEKNLRLSYEVQEGLIVFEPLKYRDDKFLGGTEKELLLSVDKWDLFYGDIYTHNARVAKLISK